MELKKAIKEAEKADNRKKDKKHGHKSIDTCQCMIECDSEAVTEQFGCAADLFGKGQCSAGPSLANNFGCPACMKGSPNGCGEAPSLANNFGCPACMKGSDKGCGAPPSLANNFGCPACMAGSNKGCGETPSLANNFGCPACMKSEKSCESPTCAGNEEKNHKEALDKAMGAL